MSQPIDGPRLPPASGAAKGLVVFLHGFGADGNDLIAIGSEWRKALPDVAFVSPHAPERCMAAPTGRQWFPLTFRDPDERRRGVVAARPTLDAFLDAELARHNLTDDRMVLVGFSQGTMMALHTGLRRAVAPAAIVGFSGLHVLPPEAGRAAFDAEISSRPPVLLVHGDADQVIEPGYLPRAVESLTARGIAVRSHLAPGLGHGIDPVGLRLAGDFLAGVLAR